MKIRHAAGPWHVRVLSIGHSLSYFLECSSGGIAWLTDGARCVVTLLSYMLRGYQTPRPPLTTHRTHTDHVEPYCKSRLVLQISFRRRVIDGVQAPPPTHLGSRAFSEECNVVRSQIVRRNKQPTNVKISQYCPSHRANNLIARIIPCSKPTCSKNDR